MFIVYQTAIPYIAERIRLIIRCLVVVTVCFCVEFYDNLIVNFAVLELLLEALSLRTRSLLKVMMEMPTGVVVPGFLLQVSFLLLLRPDNLLQL